MGVVFCLAHVCRTSHSFIMIDFDFDTELTGKLLIAMPSMEDQRFARSVIYICSHDSEGTMGLIVNKPTPAITFDALMDQLSIEVSRDTSELGVYFGGPVEHGRGFVLHSADYATGDGTTMSHRGIAMSATVEVLQDLAAGTGPSAALLTLGYAGWGAGQLRDEVNQNAWLTCDATHELVFDQPSDDKWDAALASLGVSAEMLSSTAGSA